MSDAAPETRLYLGVDPGVSGAAALLTDAGNLEALILPEWHKGVFARATIDRIASFVPRIRHATIEEVIPFGGGRRAAGLARAGRNSGMWAGMLAAIDVSDVRWVTPRTWQAKILGKVPKGETKAYSAETVRRFFPHGRQVVMAWGDGVADALCIAEWARQEDYHSRICTAGHTHRP